MFNRKLPLQIISIIFVATIIVVTMFARIQSGYHYLSDTAMTVFIASICNIAVYLGVYKLNLIKLPK
jgi:membrane-associated phospholipid phosphatase